MARLQTDVPPELKKWLMFRAVELGRTQSDLVTEALSLYRENVDPTPTPTPDPKPKTAK